MATRWANVHGILFLEEARAPDKEGIIVVTFDILGVPYAGGTDTMQIGGGGSDGGNVGTATLATIIQNRRRDGRIVTLGQVMGGRPGRQGSAYPSQDIYQQGAVVTGANITGITLWSAATGGSQVTTTTAPWDAAAALLVSYLAPPLI